MTNILDNNDNPKPPFLKVKHIIIVFAIGCILLSIGGFFKIQSWPYASELLLVGTFVQCISFFLVIVKAMSSKSNNSFLNK